MTSAATVSERIFLVDAHAYLHRAYHAMPPLTSPGGEPVGALFGFAKMLLSLIKREKPEFLAVCFDAPGPTFRHKAYAGYKATRKELDGDLKLQLALARPMVEAMGIRCAEAPGWEADDLMATMADRAARRGLGVLLVTGDKDALQLVGGPIKVLNEAKGEVLDAEKVAEKFNVRPEQIVDYLTLTGDASDNVPGVPGIGPVGAAKLLARYGSLDALLKAAETGDPELPPKAAKALQEGREQARQGRSLIELDRKAPVDLAPADCAVGPPEPERLLPVFKRFGFNSLMREMAPAAVSAAEVSGPPEPCAEEVLPEPMPLKAWLQAASDAKRVSLSLRRAGPGLFAGGGELPLSGSSWSLALALADGSLCLVDPQGLGAQRKALAALLADPAVEKLAHDFKGLMLELEAAGLPIRGPRFDAGLAAYCVDPGAASYEFSSLLERYAGSSAAGESDPARGSLREAKALFAVEAPLRGKLKEGELLRLYEDLELPLLDVLAGMEAEGISLNGGYLRGLRAEFDERREALKREIDALAGTGINLNSTKQLRKLLFEDLKLPVVHKTPKGEPSTDEETLLVLKGLHPVPAKLIDFREVVKLQSTYVEPLLEKMDAAGRVHTHFDQTGTVTGRLSSLEPNLQNIPVRSVLGQKIRRAFVPRAGCVLLSADYSQIDLRVLAHLSEDPALCEAFRNGEDVHLKTACEIFGVDPSGVDAELRRRAKAVNFGIVYGQTAHGLSLELGIPFGAAKDYIEKYLVRYVGVARWTRANLEAARRCGFVKTLLGRVRYLPELASKNTKVRLFGERAAANTPIQGTSADIIKAAMVNIHRKLSGAPARWKAKPLLQVHDELLFDVPKGEAVAFGEWARREMETAVRLKVPMVVDLKAGPNWQDMRKVKNGA